MIVAWDKGNTFLSNIVGVIKFIGDKRRIFIVNMDSALKQGGWFDADDKAPLYERAVQTEKDVIETLRGGDF